MKKACEALQEKRLISDLSISVRVERTSDWSRNWERKVSLDEECTEVFLLERL